MKSRLRKWLTLAVYYGGIAALAYVALVVGKAWATNLLPFVLVVSLLDDVVLIALLLLVAVADPAGWAKMRESVERNGGLPGLRFPVTFYLALALALAAAGRFVLACVALTFIITALIGRGVWSGAVAATATPAREGEANRECGIADAESPAQEGSDAS